ncbi:hypothetical protein VF14_35230 [Nostoc linckia z18]|uniref:Uncharacterized protein n=2 Tax=Nostoc linckia TaxID=92942 RepID=A0A9Q5Z534_NOSLI|nr:hypothetical protein [Nostoc linckia]PHK28925.1 hypothetical protein VF12_31935 [Nostoc linckia z15]PHK38848.1 hypothetical protein VF13_35390 [Nostoc linckia z16]PHJ54498.1 hypothetical protein VF02_36705 [Nostoc linckia z1]PHJ57583.1 hypothetical protein VF05_35485 [Nostoc linckia z3]PHJ58998.1 hypothetical protein VF03_34990 [Nostoc linckia z2]
MSLTFTALGEKLPAGSIEFVGNNQLKLNFTLVTGDSTLTPNSSCVEAVSKLMRGLAALTEQVNDDRAAANPPQSPIEFASSTLTGTPAQPKYVFTVEVAVDTSQFPDNLIDPTS